MNVLKLKWVKVLALALVALTLASAVAVAEEIAAEPEIEIAVEPEAPVEAPEPEPEAPVVAEPAPEPEIEVEAGEEAEGEIIEIEEPEEAPRGLAPDAPFHANVEIELKESGEIYYGDRITLVAKVTGANRNYAIRWEVNSTGEPEDWEVIPEERGDEYAFVVTPENINCDYRVVLSAA